jgi:hypothetical protein
MDVLEDVPLFVLAYQPHPTPLPSMSSATVYQTTWPSKDLRLITCLLWRLITVTLLRVPIEPHDATAWSSAVLSAGRLTERIPLMKVAREEEADTWRLIRRIDDWRRRIDRSRVAIGLIHTPAALVIPFTLVPVALVPVVLLLPLAPVVILAERRHHGETADHRGEGEYHHDLADCRA